LPPRGKIHQRDEGGHVALASSHGGEDYFPLPRIDQIIDSTAGCERLSFLDAYSGYNQIRLKVKDEDKIAFITPHGVYCYMTMPFGLKNA
jgi:hypothetical protein